MGEVQYRDGMIDIGDPGEGPERAEAAPPPHVVIEYRERGIPWMLVPPLLVLSAILALYGAKFLEPGRPKPAPAPVADARRPPAAPRAVEPAAEPAPPPEPIPNPPPSVAVTPPPAAPSPTPEPPPPVVAVQADPPAPAPPDNSANVDAGATPAPAAGPEVALPAMPRFEGVGFDPKALVADAAMPPPADPSVAPVQGGPAAAAPAPAPVPGPMLAGEDPDQPLEVDPDLLPPDPRLARVHKAERVAAARRQVEDERMEFHDQLRRILARSGERSGPAIGDLMETYPAQPDPGMVQLASKHLGETGFAVGAGKEHRITLLRAIGFSESAILSDMIEQDSRWEVKSGRQGARVRNMITYHDSVFLLKHPPTRGAITSRPAAGPAAAEGDPTAPGGGVAPNSPRTPRGSAARFAPVR